MRWLEEKENDPSEWQEAADFGDTILYVTAEELRQLERDVQTLVGRYAERTLQAELRPAGARAVMVIHIAVPFADERGR